MNLLSQFKQSDQKNSQLLIYGQDAFLNDYLVRDVLKSEKYHDLEKVTIDCKEDGLDELMATLTESSLFSQQKVVMISNPFFLTTKSPTKFKKQVAKLEKILAHLDELTDLIIFIVNDNNLDRRKKITKIVLSATNFVDTNLKPYEISNFIRKVADNEGFSLTQQANQLLIQRSDQVLDVVLSNYVKLKNICEDKKITEALIIDNISLTLSQNIFEILSSASKGDHVEAIARLEDQLKENNNPVQLLGVFESQLEFLLCVKVLQNRNWTHDQIVKELAVNPYRVKYAMQNRIQLIKLKQLVKAVIELNYGYKNGTYRDSSFLKMFLLSV